MVTNMVERVALAIAAADGMPESDEHYQRHARAAIAALAPIIGARIRREFIGAHTYASENAEIYRAQDHWARRIAADIETLPFAVSAALSPTVER